MNSNTRDELEYFESLDELTIECGENRSQGIAGSDSATNANETPVNTIAPVSKPRPSKKTRRQTQNKTRSEPVSSEEAAFALLNANPGDSKREMTNQVAVAPVLASTSTSEASPALMSAELPKLAVHSRALRTLHANRSPQSSLCRPLWIPVAIVLAASSVGLWSLFNNYAGPKSANFTGHVTFDFTEPQATFIQLMRLNSPREEEFVAEVSDGQFEIQGVSPGEYALWFATRDGTAIPCCPLGASKEFLTESEYSLGISINSSDQELTLQIGLRTEESSTAKASGTQFDRQ